MKALKSEVDHQLNISETKQILFFKGKRLQGTVFFAKK